MEELIKSMAKKEAKKIIEKDIVDINDDFLNKKFNIIDLSNNDDWDQFRDHYARRHLIIHTNNIIDEKYLKKFNIKQGPRSTSRIFVEKDFLSISIQLFEKYSDLIHNAFTEKFENQSVFQ
jgi:hypothetical protein